MRTISIFDTKKNEDSLERRLYDCNPILESFGNSKTIANENSSRFCKHTHVKFTEFGFIHSADIEAYLLEKSRVVHVPTNERNYHIFYQVLAAFAANNPRVTRYGEGGGLSDTSFKILGTGPSQIQDFNGVPIDEAIRFEQTISSLEGSGFSTVEISSILDGIVGLMHLGNVEFVEPEDDSDQRALIKSV